MCGVCGFVRRADEDRDSELVRRMIADMGRRGPDGSGVHLDEAVALGHARLSILDVEGGAQPMADATGRYVVTFNGEIYNYPELAARLRAEGVRLRTACDTEVLPYLYARFGPDMTHELEGMFAFAVWDRQERTLFLARDRFGEKPLYYARDRSGGLVFASRLTALALHPDFDDRLDHEALRLYLACEYVPAPRSIFKNARKLPAGWRMLWKEGDLKLERWWELPAPPPFPGDFREAKAEFLRLLSESVSARLASDVPLGVFLSGGLDSSAVAAMMARSGGNGGRPQAFTIGFAEKSFDESGHALTVARALGVDAHVDVLSSESCADMLPEVAACYEEPFADASAIPTYLLARFARKRVTVALGGDGGDELFAGYDTFPANALAQLLRRIPDGLVRGALLPAVRLLPPSERNMDFRFRMVRLLARLREPPARRTHLWMSAFDCEAQTRLLTPELAPPACPILGMPGGGIADAGDEGGNWLAQVRKAYVEGYLQENILTKVDRATMANSLEARSPFLDTRLASFAASLPISWLLRGLSGKRLIREALADALPQPILKRPKKGFGLPKARWLRGPLRERLETAFERRKVEADGFFRHEEVRRLMDEHVSGRQDHQKELWTLLMFEEWRASRKAASPPPA